MEFDNSIIELKDGLNWLPAGDHEVFVYDFKFDTKNGKDLIVVHFKSDNEMDHMENFYMSQAAMWRLKNLSMACGIGESGKWEMSDLNGKRLIIHLKSESYTNKEGKPGSIIKAYKFSKCNNNTDSDGMFQSPSNESDPF